MRMSKETVQRFWDKVALGILVLVAVFIYIWAGFWHDFNIDEQEHLQASYLVSQGLVPYRDFFEHHHPLLWYLFTPFVLVWENSADVLYVTRVFMLVVAGGTAYYLYKTCRFVGCSADVALVSVVIWLCFPVVRGTGCEFRPDNIMIMFFMAGTAYFFQYLTEKHAKVLAVSFGLYFFSLLCLQKAIFLLVPVGAICLWLLWRREIVWRDFFMALVFPVMAAGGLAGLSFYGGYLKDYWELNWLLNLKIDIASAISDDLLYVFGAGALVALGLLFCLKNLSMRIICFLYLMMAAQMLIYRPWYAQYLLIYYPLLAIVFAMGVFYLWRWKCHFILYYLAAVGIGLQAYQMSEARENLVFKIKTVRNLYQFVLDNTDEDDLIIGDLGVFTGDMRRSALGYYWFSIGHMAALDAHYFQRRELPNLNLVMKVRRPKMIANGFWRDCSLGEIFLPNLDCKFWNTLDREYLREHYEDKGIVFVRKD